MEEKNELNDIILNKGGSNAGSKKLLLAIATFTLILIIVLVIMNSLKNDEVQKAPQAILPPEPTAPTEIINDPLFEPVEVIQEGNETAKDETSQGTTDLNQVAQKIKNESMQSMPVVQNKVVEPVATNIPASKVTVPAAPVPAKVTPVQKTTPITSQQSVPKPKSSTVTAKSQPVENVKKPHGTPTIKQDKTAVEKVSEPKKSVKETTAPAPAKVVTETKSAPNASTGSSTTYYIQVGSFTNEPNKALFDRLNASGMKYSTQKSGSVTKVLVGPFQGEKSVQDAMGSVRQNVEAKAFKIKG